VISKEPLLVSHEIHTFFLCLGIIYHICKDDLKKLDKLEEFEMKSKTIDENMEKNQNSPENENF